MAGQGSQARDTRRPQPDHPDTDDIVARTHKPASSDNGAQLTSLKRHATDRVRGASDGSDVAKGKSYVDYRGKAFFFGGGYKWL